MFWNCRLLAWSNLEADPQKTLISCKFLDSFIHWHYFHKSRKPSIFWSYSGRERPSSLCISVCFCLHYARAIDIPGLRKRVKFKPTKYYLKIQSYLYCLCSSKLIWTFLEFKLKALLMSCVSLFRKNICWSVDWYGTFKEFVDVFLLWWHISCVSLLFTFLEYFEEVLKTGSIIW